MLAMKILQLHELLQVVAWLQGTWRTDELAQGQFPTIKDFNYYDEINITSTGQPLLNYVAQAWHPETGIPLHRETGFLNIIPGSNKVVLSLIDNIGLFTVEQGDLASDGSNSFELKSTNIMRTVASVPSFPDLTEVQSCFSPQISHVNNLYRCIIVQYQLFFFSRQTKRVYTRNGDDLELVFYMATSKTPELTEHLRAKYKKVA